MIPSVSVESDENNSVVIDQPLTIENQCSQAHGSGSSTKAKKRPNKTKHNQKDTKKQKQMMDNLMKTPKKDLTKFIQKTTNHNLMTDNESLINIVSVVQNRNDGCFHPAAAVLIIYAMHCLKHLDYLLHQKYWLHPTVEQLWNTNSPIPAETMTTILIQLRKSIKTS